MEDLEKRCWMVQEDLRLQNLPEVLAEERQQMALMARTAVDFEDRCEKLQKAWKRRRDLPNMVLSQERVLKSRPSCDIMWIMLLKSCGGQSMADLQDYTEKPGRLAI